MSIKIKKPLKYGNDNINKFKLLPKSLVFATFAHRLQLGSKLFVDDQIDEEVGQVVDVDCVHEVSVDFASEVDEVQGRRERDKKREEQT